MDQNELNQIADALIRRMGGNQSPGTGSGVQRPHELDDANVDPTLRAKVLEDYTGRLMEAPQASWSAAERKIMWEQSRTVLRDMGY
jgi:hypothetical protein